MKTLRCLEICSFTEYTMYVIHVQQKFRLLAIYYYSFTIINFNTFIYVFKKEKNIKSNNND
jgi:hypothetical protein